MSTSLATGAPPRHLKSVLISVVWPAWLLGRDPSTRIPVVSHSLPLARDLGLKALRLMESEIYRQIFILREDRQQAIDFETTQNGGRYAASFATSITGRSFNASSLMIRSRPIRHALQLSATTSTERPTA